MKKSGRSDIIKIMREEYSRHLNSLLKELSVFDSRGELVIGPDLKVVHEPSGLEYTIDTVDGVPGNAKITLRTPDQPRKTAVDPAALHPELAQKHGQPEMQAQAGAGHLENVAEDDDDDSEEVSDKKNYGIQAHPHELGNDYDKGEDETVFVVNQKEFEKNYKEA